MSKESYWEFVEELSNTMVESRDTRKSKPGGQKECKKLRQDGALSSCARSLLSRMFISRVILLGGL